MGVFDLEKHFAFYGAYHSNPINVLIHIFCVWPNFFTLLMLFNHIHIPAMPYLPNLGVFKVVVYCLSYVLMDKRAGSLAALLCLVCWFASDSLGAQLGFSTTWKVVLAGQFFCCSAQFIGHKIYEKRAPAFWDSTFQAYLMAPFFVVLEVLQMLVGYEPYPGFHAKVKGLSEADIKAYHQKKQKSKSS